MEVLREAPAHWSEKTKESQVSILVLMEVLREVTPPKKRDRKRQVSILVLMEVLREG